LGGGREFSGFSRTLRKIPLRPLKLNHHRLLPHTLNPTATITLSVGAVILGIECAIQLDNIK